MNDREFLRHVVATIAYRGAKTMRGAPDSFASFKPGPTSKTPLQIVGHLGDLFDWSLTLAAGEPKWHEATLADWHSGCERFFETLRKFDTLLASETPIKLELTRLFQGPVADALTHIGQLAMLRRLHGAPMKGESYTRADIQTGRVSSAQTPADPKFEFD